MKAKIHPKYEKVSVRCTCGNTFETRSTAKEIAVSLCSKCHPFFTGGEGRLLDTAGRIEKFQRRFQIAEGQATEARTAPKKKKGKAAAGTESLRSAKAMHKKMARPKRDDSEGEGDAKAPAKTEGSDAKAESGEAKAEG